MSGIYEPVTVRQMREWLVRQDDDKPVIFVTSNGIPLELCESWTSEGGYHIRLEEA